MCGICGYTPSLSREEDKRVIENMIEYLHHRGPDGEGTYFSEKCVLGHRRLSIIDLEMGHQPMSNEDQTVWVISNGEIYNYKSLWGELEGHGHRFFSDHSDTEVIVHGYEEWGTELFGKLNGIFAIAIWDLKKKTLILARDHIGVKPLYYSMCGERFIFASEPKAILSHQDVKVVFNPEQMANYFFFRAPVHPNTLFKNIYKVAPGSFITWEPEKTKFSERVFWYPKSLEKQDLAEKGILSNLNRLLFESVKNQLISDVPLGVFLSGGIDSSLIASAVASHNGGTEGFVVSVGGENDEAKWSQKVADHLNIKNNVLEVGGEHFLKHFNQWAYVNDDPVSDPSALALLLVARFARDSGKIVMLSGEGGDELFGGYNSYLRFFVFDSLKKHAWLLGLIGGILRVSGKGNYRESDYLSLLGKDWGFLGTGHACSFKLLSQILSPELDPMSTIFKVFEKYGEKSGHAIDRACLLDQRVRLSDDLLARTDRASMAVGLEARVPLLDYGFIELANSIPQKMKFKGFCLKYVLKKIASNYIPKDVVYRKKMGFDLPLDVWLRNDFADNLHEYVFKKDIPFLNYGYIEVLLDKFFTGRHNKHVDFLWSYLMLEKWYELWCKGNIPSPWENKIVS